MLRYRRALALILLTVFLVPCYAWAQSPKGHWDRGRWIGYMPPHMNRANQTRYNNPAIQKEASEPTPKRDQEEPDAQAEQNDEAVTTSSKKDSSVKQARYVPHAQSSRYQGAQQSAARRQSYRVASHTPNNTPEPVTAGQPAPEYSGMLDMSCSDNCASCGGNCTSCCDNGCCCCGEEFECGISARWRPRWFWGRAEYLGWWTSGMHVPALVTTCTEGYPTLDNATTSILIGNERLNNEGRSGGRFTLGMWFDPNATRGIDITYMGLGTQRTRFYANQNNYARLGRPFYDIANVTENAELIAFPSNPEINGSINVSVETKFQGTEILYRRGIRRWPCSKVDMLFGWRWMQLKDNLNISETVNQTGVGENNLCDIFDTTNNFNGLEIGFQWERPVAYQWTFEMLGKLSLGSTNSVVKINGAQEGDAHQGLLALNSNSGKHSRRSFASIAEIGFGVKRRFHCGLEATFGYTFLYWSDVMRAGDQIDLNVDTSQVPGTAIGSHPTVPMRQTDFWAQGLHFGLEYPF